MKLVYLPQIRAQKKLAKTSNASGSNGHRDVLYRAENDNETT